MHRRPELRDKSRCLCLRAATRPGLPVHACYYLTDVETCDGAVVFAEAAAVRLLDLVVDARHGP